MHTNEELMAAIRETEGQDFLHWPAVAAVLEAQDWQTLANCEKVERDSENTERQEAKGKLGEVAEIFCLVAEVDRPRAPHRLDDDCLDDAWYQVASWFGIRADRAKIGQVTYYRLLRLDGYEVSDVDDDYDYESGRRPRIVRYFSEREKLTPFEKWARAKSAAKSMAAMGGAK